MQLYQNSHFHSSWQAAKRLDSATGCLASVPLVPQGEAGAAGDGLAAGVAVDALGGHARLNVYQQSRACARGNCVARS